MKTRYIFILLFIILLAILIFIFRNDEKTLSIIFVSSSGLAVITAIIFEGELKDKTIDRKVSKLTGVGLFLLILSIFVSIGNGMISYNSIEESKAKSKADSINSKKIIGGLKEKRKIDSLNIIDLNRHIARLDTTLILNTLKELEEQRQEKEREKENIFIHFRNEILLDMSSILINLDDDKIKSFDNTDKSTNWEIRTEYQKKYLALSANKSIISYLTIVKDQIEQVNMTIQFIFYSTPDHRTHNINALREMKNETYKYLYSILCRIQYLKSYKEYEATDFYKRMKIINIETILALYDYEFTPASKKLIEDTIKEIINENKKCVAN